MDKKDIDLLVTVSKSKNFSEAAFALNYTPSAISKQIAGLEKEFGVKLIRRSNRASSVSMTPEGEKLMPDLLALQKQFERFECTLAALRSENEKRLRLGVRNRLSYLERDNLLSEYIQKFPEVRLELTAGSYENHLAGVLDGKLDGVFLIILKGSPNYEALCEAIRDPRIEAHFFPPIETMYLYVSEKSPLAQLDEAPLSAFRDYKITFSSDPHIVEFGGVMEPFLRISRETGCPLNPLYADTHNLATLNLARNGKVAVPIITDTQPHPGLKAVRLTDWNTVSVSCFLMLAGNRSGPLTELLRLMKAYEAETTD